MSTVIFGALCASIIMSAGRNLLSKSISDLKFGTHGFFIAQATIFFCGFVILIVPAKISNESMSILTVVYALIYALLLITAQWSYTAALGGGNTAVCVTIYSLGFIFPTLSGSLFWNETFTVKNMLGLIAVIMAVIISGYQKDSWRIKARYFLPLVSSMAASGGLGIMQKVQQSSRVSNQKAAFVMIAFLIASIISLSAALVSADTGVQLVRHRFNDNRLDSKILETIINRLPMLARRNIKLPVLRKAHNSPLNAALLCIIPHYVMLCKKIIGQYHIHPPKFILF